MIFYQLVQISIILREMAGDNNMEFIDREFSEKAKNPERFGPNNVRALVCGDVQQRSTDRPASVENPEIAHLQFIERVFDEIAKNPARFGPITVRTSIHQKVLNKKYNLRARPTIKSVKLRNKPKKF